MKNEILNKCFVRNPRKNETFSTLQVVAPLLGNAVLQNPAAIEDWLSNMKIQTCSSDPKTYSLR